MLLAGGVMVSAAAAGVYAGVQRVRQTPAPTTTEEEGEIITVDDAEEEEDEKPKKSTTWRESSGRTSGRDGYVFGDLTRGVVCRLYGSTPAEIEETKAIEAAGDEQYTQVQKLVSEAVKIFRARGYNGSINMSHSVAYFTETCSVKVDPPETLPWLGSDATSSEAQKLAAMAENGKAGRVFATLLARLERRALSWQAMNAVEGLDPSLTSSAQIGFRMPVINVGWGISVSLTVTTSSLVRWSAHAATREAQLESEARMNQVAAAVTSASLEKALDIANAAEPKEPVGVD